MNDIGPAKQTVPATSPVNWKLLLELLRKGLLIPVIGPELLCIPHEDDPAARLYDLWGQELADLRGMKMPAGDAETPLLYRVTNLMSVDKKLKGEFAYDIHEVIRERHWSLPSSLLQLAEITDFPIYLTTTIDHLLEAALKEAHRTRDPQVIAFKPGGKAIDNDLPRDFVPGQRPVVFHLFGRTTSTDPDAFAATEDALIEFSWALIDHDDSPKNLYDFLGKKTILLLGCNFPDWLDRFFIHALTGKRDINIWYISEYQMAGLHDFLDRKGAKSPSLQSPATFVAELYRRWQAGDGSDRSETGNPSKFGAVFISYAKEDQAAALAIRKQLEAAHIDTWMDESGLEPGVEFQEEIRDNIYKASFFLPLVSRSLNLEGSGRLGRFVFREWKWAEDAAEERLKDDRFLQPVVIDNTPPGATFIDRPYRDMQWTSLQGGALPQNFIDFVKKGFRHFCKDNKVNRAEGLHEPG